jgi:acyl-CoA thioester hydrolase
MTDIAAPFRSSCMSVEDDWIDYNGHMNVAYYLVLLDRCVDEAFEELGMGPDYVTHQNASFFTVEIHINYLRELPPRAPVVATLQLLAHDEKRIRAWLELYHAEEGFLSASCEMLFLHVDMATRRTAPFPDQVMTRITAMSLAHSALPWPERAGRSINLKSKKNG